MAFQRFNSSNEAVIYSSIEMDEFDHGNMTKTSELADKFLKKNPELDRNMPLKNDDDEEYSVVPYLTDDMETKLKDFQKELADLYEDELLQEVADQGWQKKIYLKQNIL